MISLHLASPGGGGRSTDVRAVIDTGFTDWLTLPPDVVRHLELPLRGSADVMLADGSVAALRTYRVGLWYGTVGVSGHGLTRPPAVRLSAWACCEAAGLK